MSGARRYEYIDCLRGYAILMVMLCHTTVAYSELPYPAHKLGVFGWHGVQLFFLASSITLLLSANQERARTGGMDRRSFFTRRILRICPMYYLAVALYALLVPPPPVALTLPQVLATMTFVSAWHPVTTSTTDAWSPGSWSIGVEFTFYFLFPAFAALVTSARRALLLLAATLAAGAVLDTLLLGPLTSGYGRTAADNFLYFWFFNQAPVFVLGALTFFAIRAVDGNSQHALVRFVRRWPAVLIVAAIGLEVIVAMAPLSLFTHQLLLAPAPPQHLIASAGFMLFILGMSQVGRGLLVNPLVAYIGKVSFSAFLLHFHVIRLVLVRHPDLFHLHAKNWHAIAVWPLGFLFVAVVSCLISSATYPLVEEPFMRWARRLTQKSPPAPAAAPSVAL